MHFRVIFFFLSPDGETAPFIPSDDRNSSYHDTILVGATNNVADLIIKTTIKGALALDDVTTVDLFIYSGREEVQDLLGITDGNLNDSLKRISQYSLVLCP